MNKIIILLLVILIIYYLNNREYFSDVLSTIEFPNNEENYVPNFSLQKEKYLNQLTMDYKPSLKCCLIENKYIPDDNNELGGKFEYVYKPMENENCDLKLFRIDSNKQVYFEGNNNWSNANCNPQAKKLGSCRNTNKECIDFVDENFCKEYNMVWSEQTCRDPTKYVWKDKSNFVFPEKTDNTFKMF